MERDGPIATITFNDPNTLNALTRDFLTEYWWILKGLSKDDSVNVVILTGTGKAFMAGADIAYMSAMSPHEAAVYAKETVELYRMMEEMEKVFIAAVNGYALGGGCELAMACDLRVASTRAKFGLPEVGLGIFPAGGGTQRLPHLVGDTWAKELIFTGSSIDAKRAETIGLVNSVVEPEELADAAHALALRVLRNSQTAVALAKRSVDGGHQMTLDAAVERDQGLFGLCFGTPDQKEGMGAFLEKRPAVFQHQIPAG
ncbi:enoyl-CoA hydratase-related protein [Pseudoflavonifractor phocaeensis]|uniref:enoyl-CoA hydratase/isomerase family protein n=1 Tax=Pseudoflavonifractor phocaeensis TaxID=1870988 RepID=UPI00313B5557